MVTCSDILTEENQYKRKCGDGIRCAEDASASTCPYQCKSSHPAGRSHCHGNHFCTHSGTSQAGWHSGSGCGTGSGPLHTRRYLWTHVQVSEDKPRTLIAASCLLVSMLDACPIRFRCQAATEVKVSDLLDCGIISSPRFSIFPPPHTFCSFCLAHFVSGMQYAYARPAQRREVVTLSRESKSLSSIMYGPNSVSHLQLRHFWM